MSQELKMPRGGMGITEGTIAKWHKELGQAISQGEVLVEIETAKAVEEVRSPIDGVLDKILAGQGTTVEVNATIAVLRAAGEA